MNTIELKEITYYRFLLMTEMKKLGTTDNELRLISDTMIRNAIQNKRNPETVTWAILQ